MLYAFFCGFLGILLFEQQMMQNPRFLAIGTSSEAFDSQIFLIDPTTEFFQMTNFIFKACTQYLSFGSKAEQVELIRVGP